MPRKNEQSANAEHHLQAVGRRRFLAAAAGLAAAGFGHHAARAQTPPPSADRVAGQLPVDAVGLEHIGTVVPDVTVAARFFGRVFNPFVYKEMAPPLRYYVTLDPGYIALGSRDGEPKAFIDHDCVLAEAYDRAAMSRRLELEGLPAGRFGIIQDEDGLGLQLLAGGGLAGSTEPAGQIVTGSALVRPRGLHRVLRYVSDLEESLVFYRKFFGQELGEEQAAEQGMDARWFLVGHTYFGIRQVLEGETPRIDRFCVNVAAGNYDAAALGAALTALGADVRSTVGDSLLHFTSPEGIGVELRPVDPARMWGRG